MFRSTLCAVLVVLGLALVLTSAVSADLVGWWKLDGTSGTTAVDSSGRDNHGTLNNGATWGPGQINGGVVLDGTDDYVDLPIGRVLSGLENSTFTIWANWTQQGGAWQRLWDLGNSSSSGYMFLCANAGGATGPLRLGITLTTNGAVEQQVSSPSTLPTGWHHVTVTIDADNDDATLWVDGEVVAQNTEMTLAPTNLGNTSQNYLGRSLWPDPYFNGALDDFRIYNEVLSQDAIKEAMLGLGPVTGIASSPSPRAWATDVPNDTLLTWMPGPYAHAHDVYIGTDFDDVNSAARGSPLLVSQGQTATTYAPPGLLDFGQTYYWRVDEVNAPPDNSIWKGETWSFTAEPYAYPVTPVAAKASNSYNSKMMPINTINNSGLNLDTDEHSTSSTAMWQSGKTLQPAYIQYEFDQVYKLHQMWVWNHNGAMELDMGYGAKEVAIETSVDGTAWTPLANVPEFAQATAEPNYVHNTTVDFGGVLAKYVKLTIVNNWCDGASPYRGLSEVRFFQAPLRARSPEPESGSTDVALSTSLNWRPGRDATSHEVYFGTDPNALALSKTVTDHRVALTDLSAEYDQTYYWRVNEVNAAAEVPSWEGQVWDLTTAEYQVVDNMESYTNDDGTRIYQTWSDGYGTANNGSQVGNLQEPYAERTIVHRGRQSMPFSYDNTSGFTMSEAVRTFSPAQNWSQGGIKTLVLFFRGDPGNGAGELYVKINNTKVAYSGSANALTRPLWKQWNVDLTSVPGLNAVQSLTIGVSGSVRGKLFVDDIRLYRAAPEVPVPADPGTTGLSAYYTFEGNVQDSSGRNSHGTAVNDPTYTDSQAGLGQAIQLDGVNDYVELPIGSLVSTLNSATVATWVSFDPTSTGTDQRIFDFGTDTTFYMFLTPRTGAAGSLRFGITTTGNTGQTNVDGASALSAGWHHVAVVIDGASRTVQLYLDGDMVNSDSTNTLPMDLGVTPQNWLGRSQWTADGYFTGMLDEFRIYNQALSWGQVLYLAGDR